MQLKSDANGFCIMLQTLHTVLFNMGETSSRAEGVSFCLATRSMESSVSKHLGYLAQNIYHYGIRHCKTSKNHAYTMELLDIHGEIWYTLF